MHFFCPQLTFYSLFLNEDSRIEKKCLGNCVDHFDYMQVWLRLFCLNLNACKVLKAYLIFGGGGSEPPERDQTLMPAPPRRAGRKLMPAPPACACAVAPPCASVTVRSPLVLCVWERATVSERVSGRELFLVFSSRAPYRQLSLQGHCTFLAPAQHRPNVQLLLPSPTGTALSAFPPSKCCLCKLSN